jgi:hypothetical protein
MRREDLNWLFAALALAAAALGVIVSVRLGVGPQRDSVAGAVVAGTESRLKVAMQEIDAASVDIQRAMNDANGLAAEDAARRRIALAAPEIVLQANLVVLEKPAGLTGPQSQRWEDMMDTLAGNAKQIRRLALNTNNDFREVPKAFATMTRTCTRCHDEFWLK